MLVRMPRPKGRGHPLPQRHMPEAFSPSGRMMHAPGPGAAPVEVLEHELWRLLGPRSKAVGEERFRRLVRLTVRHWPTETLERIRRANLWPGVERKKAGRILLARVREAYEAADGVTPAWPILLEGTVALLWVALCDRHARDPDFRSALSDLSRWVARHGIG